MMKMMLDQHRFYLTINTSNLVICCFYLPLGCSDLTYIGAVPRELAEAGQERLIGGAGVTFEEGEQGLGNEGAGLPVVSHAQIELVPVVLVLLLL